MVVGVVEKQAGWLVRCLEGRWFMLWFWWRVAEEKCQFSSRIEGCMKWKRGGGWKTDRSQEWTARGREREMIGQTVQKCWGSGLKVALNPLGAYKSLRS